MQTGAFYERVGIVMLGDTNTGLGSTLDETIQLI